MQDKLRQEVRLVEDNLNGGDLTYEALLKIKFLDQFVTGKPKFHFWTFLHV